MNLSKLIELLPIVGPALAQAEEFTRWWDEVTAALNPADQAAAKAALAIVQADNNSGHARLQAKLAEAARR